MASPLMAADECNLNEDVADWQQHDEDRNLKAIDMHEVAGATEHATAQSFNKEVNKTEQRQVMR